MIDNSIINGNKSGEINSRKNLTDDKSTIKQPINQKNSLSESFPNNSSSGIYYRNLSKTEEVKIEDVQMLNSNNVSTIKSARVNN